MMARISYLTNYLLAASLGVGFVFLADVQDAYGLADWQLGVVVASGFISALVTQLLLAPFADRGRIVALVWTSVVAGVVGCVGFAFATSTITLLVSRGLVGVGLGLFSVTARKALIGLDTAGGGKKVGALLSTGVAGFISGPVFGLAFGEIAFEAPFIVIGLALAVVGPIAARLIAKAPIAVSEVDYSDVGELLSKPRVQIAILVQFVVFGFIGIFDSTIDRYLTDLGASNTATTLVILAVGAPMLFLPIRMGDLADRVGGVRVLVPGMVLMVLTISLFGFAPNPLALAFVGAFQGVAESSGSIGGQVLVLEASGAERVAIGSAILETVGLLTATVTSFVAPLVYGARGEVWLFGGYAAISAAAVAALVLRSRSMDPAPAPAGIQRVTVK